ncbi:hypothetical protein KP509_38G015500 [Ceratopteris richardii]|nr:hypothetical protein KP509_38G015500 [Ceratopteris richardii]
MCNFGLDKHSFFGDHLVSMFVKVGSTGEAQRLFNTLQHPGELAWNALISGYVQCGKADCALILYQKIQENALVCLNEYTIVGLLQACGKLKDLKNGCKLNDAIMRLGFLTNPHIGTSLLDMYAKCGSLGKAQQVFNELTYRDSVTWNALIVGYVDHGHGEEALKCFKVMQDEGIPVDVVTYTSTLKACAILGNVIEGFKINAEIAKHVNLECNIHVGNALVDMYCKCGLLNEAHDVFNDLSFRDVVSSNALLGGYCKQGLLATAQKMFDNLEARDTVSWNIMMSGCIEYGDNESVLSYFKCMQAAGVHPSRVTYVCALKAVSSVGNMMEGEAIHVELARNGLLKRDIVVSSCLVVMYVKCGSLSKAHEIFNMYCTNCVISGSVLVAGYVEKGLFLETHELFDSLPIRNVVTWNTLIAGYTEHGLGHEALNCYDCMQLEGVDPNAVTFLTVLKACASIKAIDKGLELHMKISQNGLLENDTSIGNTLLDMYIKCEDLVRARDLFDKLLVRDAVSWNSLIAGYAEKGLLVNAKELFDQLSSRDVVSWNALITGYIEYGLSEEALECLEQMQYEGISPDAVTYICCLKACMSLGASERGERLHTEIAKRGLLEKNLTLCNTVIDMYTKCGLLIKAQNFLDELSCRDVVSWNTLISGYVEHGDDREALNCFEKMQAEGISPDVVTLTCILKACGNIGAVERVQKLHADISRRGLWEIDLVLGNTLIYVCINCGLLAEAQEAFNKLPVRDVVSWNAFLAGNIGLIGHEDDALVLDKMTKDGIEPNCITFLNNIKRFNQHGLVDQSMRNRHVMDDGFDMETISKHHNTMVDLLGRVGHLDKAMDFFLESAFCRNPVACHAVLESCRKWGNTELARYAFNLGVQMGDKVDDADSVISTLQDGAQLNCK